MRIEQRTYSWTSPERLHLWNEMVRAAHDDVSGPFIGSIVYIDTGIYQVSGASTIEVIDGQQRLTTISLLLLLAVSRAIASDGAGDEKTARKIVKDSLHNSRSDSNSPLPGVEELLFLERSLKGVIRAFSRLTDVPRMEEARKQQILARYKLRSARFEASRHRGRPSLMADTAPVPGVERRALSKREIEVLKLMADGLTNGEIAKRLYITPHTATSHTRRVIAKLGTASRAHAVAVGFRSALIS